MKKMMIGIAVMGFLSSCQQVAGWLGSNNTDSTGTLTSESANAAKLVRDESITRETAYSDLFLDSAALENYIRTTKLQAGKADRMREFYLVRNNQFAWFSSGGATEQARGLWSLYAGEAGEKKDSTMARLEKHMDSLLTTFPAGQPEKDTVQLAVRTQKALPKKDSNTAKANDTAALASQQPTAFSESDSSLVQTELALTEKFVELALANRGVVTAENFYWLVPRKKLEAMQLADSLLNRQPDSARWRNNTQYMALKNSLQHYHAAAKNGGWPVIAAAAGLRKGSKSPAVVQLKKRLAMSGDYVATDTSALYSDSLAMAVMAVQQQFGLKPTGQVSDSLVQALNVPAEQRVQQILVNMNRALWMPPLADSSHISINIPAQELVVHTDSGQVMTMPVIIGKEGTGTMAFSDEITQVVFSPYWNLPQSIVQNEIKPAMQKDPSYLEKKNMEIVKQEGDYLEIRQLPGKDNALGRVKFLFPNTFDIYLHDTPHKSLFAQTDRALSHGCIRVAKPDSLAAFVLRGQTEWTPEKIAGAMSSGKEQTVPVKNPVPVSIIYYTAWSQNGKLHFRNDVYGYDQKTAERMFTNTAPPATARR